MRLLDRVGLLLQEARRPESPGEVMTLAFELGREAAVENHDPVERERRAGHGAGGISPTGHGLPPRPQFFGL